MTIWTAKMRGVKAEQDGEQVAGTGRVATLNFRSLLTEYDAATGTLSIGPESNTTRAEVNAATTAALAANTRTGNTLTADANGALAAIDGVTLTTNNRLLVKDEASTLKNGWYYVADPGSASTPWQLTRTADADASAEFVSGAITRVLAGTVNAGTSYVLTVGGGFTLNTDAVTFTLYNLNAIEQGVNVGDVPQFEGTTYVPRRFWITPDIDLTGTTDATAAILAAAQERVGACVYLPDGVIRMNSGITLPQGACITGRERGMARGHRGTGGTPLLNTGTLIHVYGTGKLFTMGMQSAVRNLELYYPSQVTTGTPTAYDYAFYCGSNADGCTIENITAINPYDLIHIDTQGGGGARIDNVWAFPFSHGIRLGRVADVARISNVHFNPANNDSGAPTAWVLANGIAFLVDGAEQFSFTDCFAYGYLRGLLLIDADADSFQGVYGDWKGGGFDQCEVCVLIADPTGLCMRGLKMSDVSFIPIDTTGYGIVSQDDTAASIPDNRPTIYVTNCQFSGTSHPKNVWLFPNSNARVVIKGGSMQGASTQHCHAEGTASIIDLDDVITTGAVTRISGGGKWSDRNGRKQVAGEMGPSYRNGDESLGADLTDADATITIAGAAWRVLPPATLSTNRVVDIDNTSAVDEETITIDRQDTTANTLTIRDNANATIFTFPASTAMKCVFRKAAGGNFVPLRATRTTG
jgi:hypothetical protein